MEKHTQEPFSTAPPSAWRRWSKLAWLIILSLTLAAFSQAWWDGGFLAGMKPWGCSHRRTLNAHASDLLRKYPLIDGHVDVPAMARWYYDNKVEQMPFDAIRLPNGVYPMRGHVDIPRLREGQAGGFFWSAFVLCPNPQAVGKDFELASSHQAVQNTLEQLDVIHQMVAKYHKDFKFTNTAASARKAFKQGKLISFIGIEGGHSLGNSLMALRTYASAFARPGEIGPVRYLTLTHTCHNAFADSSSEDPPRWGGLSVFGKHLIQELNRLAIVPDLSHTSDDTASQAIDESRGPVMLSHSSAQALNDVPRNAPDWLLRKLRKASAEHGKDNIVMINIYPGFIGGSEDLAQVVRHISHIASIVGRDHVGIGTDFDGIVAVPKGLEDVSQYPSLVKALLTDNWSDKEIGGFLGENILRVLESAEKLAKKMAKEGVQPDNTAWKDLFGHHNTSTIEP